MKKNKTTKKKMPHPISGEVLHSDMSVDSQGQGKGSMKVKTLSVPGGGRGGYRLPLELHFLSSNTVKYICDIYP